MRQSDLALYVTRHLIDKPSSTPSPTPSPASGGVSNPWDGLYETLPPTPLIWLAACIAILLGVAAGLIYRALVPAPGFATAVDIRRHMSAAKAKRKLAQTRPSIARPRNLPVSEYSYLIGRCWSPWMKVRGGPEDSALVEGPPGAGKTIWMQNIIIDAPGAVLHTSSKIEDHVKTIEFREQVGPVLLFNPHRLGGYASTVRINPIRGCEDLDVAIERGGFLLYGARRPGASSNVDEYFTSTANEVLRAFLHAAALAKLTLLDVQRWANNPDDQEALQILAHYQAPQSWISTLRGRQSTVDRTRDGIFSSLATALSWLASPEAARCVTPGPGEEPNWEQFINERGTLYMVGEDLESGSVAPLFTLIITHFVDTAVRAAAHRPGGRLDPWLTLALDEVATICPVPLPRWINKLRSHGVLLIAAVQSKAQLNSRWGHDGGAAIWNAAAYTLVLPGLKDGDDLRELSELIGEREVTKTSTQRTANGPVRTEHTDLRPIMPPNKIRGMKDGRMLVIYRGAPAVIVHIQKPWKRRDLKRRLKAGYVPPAQLTTKRLVSR